MADIRPFRGVRPIPELAGHVASLPYDVYDRKEAYAAAARDRLSFLNIDRPETQFPENVDMYAPKVYQKAHDMLMEEVKKGVFVQDEKSCYYIYELTMDGRSQTGVVACASIDDYLGNIVKKHENTRAEKEEDRIHHVDVCSAQTGPIFLAYRKDARIEAATAQAKKNAPLFDFTSQDGIRHRGWMIADGSLISRIQQAFASISQIYIADGHHRAASAVRVGLMRRKEHPDHTGQEEFNYFLSILFPDEELLIMDYNRVVRDLNGLTREEFLDRVSEIFTVHELEAAQRPEKKGTMTMYLDRKWYHLTLREHIDQSDSPDDPVQGLDVSVLQNKLLGPVLGIQDPKKDARIDFIGGIRGLGELERRVHTDCAVAFALHPTSIGELFAVADAGLLMPPKSTWFEPKLRSGLFIHMIEE